jgi:hypothetical protein
MVDALEGNTGETLTCGSEEELKPGLVPFLPKLHIAVH